MSLISPIFLFSLLLFPLSLSIFLSSQKGEDGDKRWKKRSSQFCYDGLQRYTALDAVGWV